MRRSVLAIIAAVCLALGGAALAQKPSAKDLEIAKNHFLSGASYYREGLYEDAIREFKRSYELSKKADILYNMAQCYGKLGDDPTTVTYLKQYLAEKPNAEDKTAVEVWIKNLESKIAAASRPPSPSPSPEPSPSASPEPSPSPSPLVSSEPSPSPEPSASPDTLPQPPEPVTRTVSRDRGKGLRIAGYVTGAVGLGLVGAGIFYAIKSGQSADNLEKLLEPVDPITNPNGYGIYDDNARKLEKQGADRERLAKIFTVVGAGVTLGGGVLWFLGYRKRSEQVTITERSTYVTGLVVPGGGGAMVGGRF